MRRVTLNDIARKARVSPTAVSLALRNSPGVSAATRMRVQTIARQLGYHPDPKLTALMQHLRTQAGGEYRETIAFVSSFARYDDWKMFPQHDYYLGARDRAEELGYRVELFHLAASGMTPARLSRLLTARGIRGLLISASRPKTRLALNWERFAVVSFGHSLVAPELHRAISDPFFNMTAALHHLRRAGCRRIGFCLHASDDSKVLGLWRSAYLLFSDSLPPDRRIPVNISPDGRDGLEEWLRRHRPDAIISSGCDFPADYEKLLGRPPPAGVAYVNLNIAQADARSRGIDTDSHAVGRLACEHLVAMLQRNETGVPRDPQVLSLKGKWVENYAAWRLSLGHRTPPQLSFFSVTPDDAATPPRPSADGYLTNRQWALIRDLLPGRAATPGVTAGDNRLFVDAVLYRHRERLPWRRLPARFGDFRIIHARFQRWLHAGVWTKVLRALGPEMLAKYEIVVRSPSEN